MLKYQHFVGILTFISVINTTSERHKARDLFICRYFSFYVKLKFRAQLSWAWKMFYNLGACSFIMKMHEIMCWDICVIDKYTNKSYVSLSETHILYTSRRALFHDFFPDFLVPFQSFAYSNSASVFASCFVCNWFRQASVSKSLDPDLTVSPWNSLI